MIPLEIDGLLPVERRILLTMYRISRKNITKSAKIVGQVIGDLHPHGDISSYGTLVKLVHLGFADKSKSTWGGPGLEDTNPPSMRYTETRLESWVADFAFEYIDFVPWELLEIDNEPLYLPSILPLGLIGEGLSNGIAFHKTVIPKYKKKDLAIRLLWLLENGKLKFPKTWESEMPESKYGPRIAPNKQDCVVSECEKNAFYKILMSGEGIVKYQPNVIKSISKKGQKEAIYICGRAPNATFNPLLRDYSKNKLSITDKPIDQSKKQEIKIYVEPKRGTDIDKFIDLLKLKYLDKNVNFKCYFCDLGGTVKQLPIDDILLNCYEKWKAAALKKLHNDVMITNNRIVENFICYEIKNILHKQSKVMSVSDIIKYFDFKKEISLTIDDNGWKKTNVVVTEELVKTVCSSASIRKLVEYKSNEKILNAEFAEIKEKIENHDSICINRIKNIINEK